MSARERVDGGADLGTTFLVAFFFGTNATRSYGGGEGNDEEEADELLDGEGSLGGGVGGFGGGSVGSLAGGDGSLGGGDGDLGGGDGDLLTRTR